MVYKSPFPRTVSACLFEEETTAIRSLPPQIKALCAQVFCQPPPSKPYTHLTIEHCSGATYTFRTIWFVFRQSTDKALLMLIKDDVSEIYSTYAKNCFNVGCIRQMPFAKQTLFEKTLSIPLPFFSPLPFLFSSHKQASF